MLTPEVLIIHFASKAQVELLEKIFTDHDVHVFCWPMAGGEAMDESLIINNTNWLSVMKESAYE